MTIIFEFLTPLHNSFLPYLLIVIGFIVITISMIERLAWILDIAPRVLLRLLPVGLVLAMLGIGLLLVPGVETAMAARADAIQEEVQAQEAAAVEAANNVAPWITVRSPRETTPCTPVGPSCYFEVKGQVGGKNYRDYRIYTFVFPLEPLGPGYYLQDRAASVDSEGNWTQFPSYFGSPDTQAESGYSFKLQAVLVRADATYYGTGLDQLPPNFYLGSVDDIDGVVAVSEAVYSTVK